MKEVIYKKEENKIPIKNWATDIEEGAMEQAKNLSNLPFTFRHVSLIPDCLSEDTEVLTENGFKLIKELSKKDKVANYDPKTKKFFFVSPKRIIIRDLRKNEKMIRFNNCNLNKSLLVTENHGMALKEELGIKAKDIKTRTQLKDYVWASNGLLNDKEYKISDELLCLIAWIVGDGNVKQSNPQGDGTFSSVNIRFGIRKKRKIKRILSILNALDLRHSVRHTEKQTTISIMVKESRYLVENFVGYDKSYPIDFISKLSHRQALLFLEECIMVDGDWLNYENCGTIRYNSKKEKDINFLSSLIVLHMGMAKDCTRMTEGYKRIKMHYLQVIKNVQFIESNSGFGDGIVTSSLVPYDKKVVCITCDTGFFIARQNGMTFISGNCHWGFGMPIGGVLATRGVVIPYAVGSDIGCGMCAQKTSILAKDFTTETLKEIMGEIRKQIPVGVGKHNEEPCEVKEMPGGHRLYAMDARNSIVPIYSREFNSAMYQLGSLGGGNHFIEIQKGSDGHVWIMLHSGSRNLGYTVADHYNKVAQEINAKYHSVVTPDKKLAFLPLGTKEADDYIEEMNYCLEFAYLNRMKMMNKIVQIFILQTGCKVDNTDFINIHHNYATMENHFGKNVMVHRKGATSARKGQKGIIPGSQGTSSYIVEGLGNPESFNSCSHGAGRKMGRKQAILNLDLAKEQKILEDKGIIHSIRTVNDLDEAPSSYKDIDEVMENQKDLVKILIKLEPLGVVKG